jgi:N6-L-threonylcarbamoyladenine synthase
MGLILVGIESSCDDTSVAVINQGRVLSNVTYTQVSHEKYGGVVPEVASREHIQKILPVVDKAISDSGIDLKDVNAIAVTQGPGLVGSLLVGISFAKGLSLSLEVPLIGVNHLEAHVLSHFAEEPFPKFPFLCLTVSGGHTQIVKVSSVEKMEILGQTIDDAAGEAFDKSGKILGLPYPAGPHIDRLAKQGKVVFDFPKPRIEGLDFSFSGLKTSILYFLKKELKKDPEFINDNLQDLCASIQSRIVTILLDKMEKAVEKTGITEIAIAGGVSANSALREAFLKKESLGWNIYIPKFEYCTDNGGMIAVAGYYKFTNNKFSDLRMKPEARFPLGVRT